MVAIAIYVLYVGSKARQSLQLNLDVYVCVVLLDRYVTL